MIYYKDQVFFLRIQENGLINVYKLSQFLLDEETGKGSNSTKKPDSGNIKLDEVITINSTKWNARGVYNVLSSVDASNILFFRDVGTKTFPKSKFDYWFILAGNFIFGFKVNIGGDIESQIKYRITIGTSESVPSSIIAYKDEVNYRVRE